MTDSNLMTEKIRTAKASKQIRARTVILATGRSLRAVSKFSTIVLEY